VKKNPVCPRCNLHPKVERAPYCRPCLRVYQMERLQKLKPEHRELLRVRQHLLSRLRRSGRTWGPCLVCGVPKVLAYHLNQRELEQNLELVKAKGHLFQHKGQPKGALPLCRKHHQAKLLHRRWLARSVGLG